MAQLFLTGPTPDATLESILQFLQVKAPPARAARLSKSKRSFKNQFLRRRSILFLFLKCGYQYFFARPPVVLSNRFSPGSSLLQPPKNCRPTRGNSRSRNAGSKVTVAGSHGLVTGDRCPRGPADREGFLVGIAPILGT